MTADQIVRAGAEVVSRCEVVVDSQVVGTPQIVSGTVAYDFHRRVLRDCQVTLVADPPSGPGSLLAPVGGLLRLYRGWREPPVSTALWVQHRDLPAPGGDVGRLTADADGTLVTANQGAGSASAAYLRSADGTVWQVAVADDMALTTTLGAGPVERLILRVGTVGWEVLVADDGTLVTAPGPLTMVVPGGTHLEAVGVYAFDETSVVRRSGVVDVGGYDLSQVVGDARWEAPYTPSGTVDAAIADAIATRLPQPPEMLLAPTTLTVSGVVWGEERDNDPWADLLKIAAGAGMWLYFDRAGRLRLDPVPDPETDPVAWTYQPGEATYVGGRRRMFGRAVNVVVFTFEPEDGPPVSATAVDDDPFSPSYVGRYRRPVFPTSPLSGSQSQAQAAAEAELRRRVGLADQIELDVVPDPRRDVGQVIAHVDDALGGVDARHVVDALRLDLRAGNMSLTTRRRRL